MKSLRYLIIAASLLGAAGHLALTASAAPETSAPGAETAAPDEAAREEQAKDAETREPGAEPGEPQPVATAPPLRRRTRSFQPSEEITVDNSVPYPVDI